MPEAQEPPIKSAKELIASTRLILSGGAFDRFSHARGGFLLRLALGQTIAANGRVAPTVGDLEDPDTSISYFHRALLKIKHLPD